jgi:hypothetical protein
MKQHHVHIYATVRVKVAVDADSHHDAMLKADRLVCANGFPVRLIPDTGVVIEAEYAEEITGYLVDEADDPDHDRSCSYGPDHEPEGAAAPEVPQHDHAGLFVRARVALEAPDSLDPDGLNQLIADLSAAEAFVQHHGAPWPIDIHVAEVDHRHGTNIYAALTRPALMAEVAEYCREWWHETDDPRDPVTLDDETVAAVYFDANDLEFLTTERITCPSGVRSPTCPQP